MTDRRGAIAFWLAVGAAGFLLVPWYALQDSVFAADLDSRTSRTKEAAPAWLQACAHGRAWLWPLGALLAARRAAAGAGPVAHGARERADRHRRGGLRSYFFAQGFAIGPTGWYVETLGRLLPALRTGQYGMGLGAALVVASFAMLFALGLAARGFFKGDAFVAGSVVAVASLVVVFTFFPVFRILISAIEDADGAVLAVGVPRPASPPRRSGAWAASPASTRCGVAWNTLALALLCATGCTALGLAFALIATRTGLPAQEAAAHPDGAADHHAAVRHRPRASS